MESKAIEILRERKIHYRLINLSAKGVSFGDVVNYAKDEINPNEICKTVIVKDKKGDKYAFLLKGDKRVDFSKAKDIIGSKISIVSYEDLIKETGTEPWAVCPFLLNMPLFVDKEVLELQKINFGSGDHLYGLEIDSNDLKKLVNFKEVSVAQ